MGVVIGGISGGLGQYAGRFIPEGFVPQLTGRTIVGGITGGISAELYGGSFGDGFMSGAQTGAFGYLFNCAAHKGIEIIRTAEKYLNKPYQHGGNGQGDNGIDCSNLVNRAYRDTGYPIKMALARKMKGSLYFPDHPNFKPVTTPRTGDVVFYRGNGVTGHLGLYNETPPSGVRSDYNVLSATGGGVRYGRDNWFKQYGPPEYYRYVE